MSARYNHEAITEIVERLVASGALGVGERQVSLLKYLVNEELSGRGDQIRAYSIGTDVLGRAANFDPSQDAIVRVEIARLRKTLELYFATQGRQASIKIIIDKGNYRPRFVENSESPPAPVHNAALRHLVPSAPATRKARGSRRFPIALVAIVLLASLALGSWLHFRQRMEDPSRIETPLLLVQMPEISGITEQAEVMRFALQNALLRELRSHNWFNVALVSRTPHEAPGNHLRPVLHLRSYMAAINNHYLLTLILEREPTHEIVWTGRIEGEFDPNNMGAFQRYLAEAVSRDVGDLNGPMVEGIAIRSATTSSEADTPFRCMLNARRYLRFNGTKQFEDAKACLTRLLDQDASQNSLRAMLIYLLIEEAIAPHLSPLPATIGGRKVTTATGRREALLEEAQTLLDNSMPTHRFLLAARLTLAACRGQSDIVRSRLPALRSLQSNNPDAYIGLGLLAGPALEDWPLAISAEARAFSLKANPLPWYQFISAIKAGMDDDPGMALRMLSRVPMHESIMGNTLITAFGQEAGAALRVSNARANLARLGYKTTAELSALVDHSCYADAVKLRIKRGLQASMAAVPPPGINLESTPSSHTKTPGTCVAGC